MTYFRLKYAVLERRNRFCPHVDIRVLGFFLNLILTLICPWLFYLVFTVKGCALMGLVTVQGPCASFKQNIKG